MPNSTTTTGGVSTTSAINVKSGLDASLDIEQIKQDASAIRALLTSGDLPSGIANILTAIQADTAINELDTSIDLEAMKADLASVKAWLNDHNLMQGLIDIKAAVNALIFPIATRIPTLKPTIISSANTAANSPAIPAPGAGKKLIVQIMGWYDKQPTGGLLAVTGSDGVIYTSVPITSAGAGFMQKNALPANTGCIISLAAAGAGVIGSLNYAIAIEEV
jgi:hypothetical protein